jgi:SAM-dependent methyltransferase
MTFTDFITDAGEGLILDAPCGYGRNAVALAARGHTVIGIDNDRRRLDMLEQVKAEYIARSAPPGAVVGRLLTICADLTAAHWPIESASVSAIVCVHFNMTDLVPCFVSSVREGGFIYVETAGGQGGNYLELPKAGQLRELFGRQVNFIHYKERKVGPPESNAVSARLFAQKF